MLFNFWGVVAVDETPEGLAFVSSESRVVLAEGSHPLLTPKVDVYLKFTIAGNRVTGSFSNDEQNRITHPEGEWCSMQSFLGGQHSYAFFHEEQDDGQDRYVARRWNGEQIFQMPYYYAERYFAPSAVALGNRDRWTLYDLAGAKLQEIAVTGRSERRWRPRFTDRKFFFRTTEDAVYQVYDVEQRDFAPPVTVVEGLVGVYALPDGGTLLVDAEGVKRLDSADGSGNTPPLRTLHRFDTPLAVDDNNFLAWHDSTRVYLAISHWRQAQRLLALPLHSPVQGGSSAPTEEVHWGNTWEITNQCGFVGGHNYLTLQRQDLLAESAMLLWRPNEALTLQLLEPHRSPEITVTRPGSATKGKHGYRIEVADPSTNQAVRSAAFELGRLLGESCSGPYNNAPVIPDRKFDGQFHIDITCAAEPDALELGYLIDYIQYFRQWGGLSPAGSRSALADPVITWNIGVP